jgi:hypothetical protein
VPTNYKYGYSGAYNAVMEEELARRIGNVSLEAISREASQLADAGTVLPFDNDR